MDLPDLMNHARIEQNPLGKGGLAGIDVCRNSNVARPLEREGSIGRIIGAGFGLKRCRHGEDRLRSRQAEARQTLTELCRQKCLWMPWKHD